MDLQVPDLGSVSASRRGELLVHYFLSRWEDPVRDDELITLLRTAVTSETVAGQLQAVLGQLVTEPIADLGDEQAAERGTFIATQLLGLALCRYILRLEPLASLPSDDVVAAVAPSVQRYLTRATASPPEPASSSPCLSRTPGSDPVRDALQPHPAFRSTVQCGAVPAGASSMANR